MARLPNILLIMADEPQAGALSCMGRPMMNTSNLDCLAARGTAFANAFTPSPICVPARAALATGKYVHQTGSRDNALAHDGSPPPPQNGATPWPIPASTR